MFETIDLSILESSLLLAQTGFAKTMLGYVMTLALIAVGISLVVRPSSREPAEKPKRK